MIFYIDEIRNKKNTAGAKAPSDIIELCKKRGYIPFGFAQLPHNKCNLYKKIWVQLYCNRQWNKLYKKMACGDILIFQHPSYGQRTSIKWIKKIASRGCKTIALIHDLESLRGGISGIIHTSKSNNIGDSELLRCFSYVICHNSSMKKYMISQGFDADRIVELEIFDYLSNTKILEPVKQSKPSVCVAGNLAIGKSGYIYKIYDKNKNNDLIVHLFGIRFDKEHCNGNMNYHGSFKPEELPKYLEGDFGLVWDGPEADTCAGNTGEYLKYNNPHKTSLYLSSGLPVIVWSQAAVADFVRKHCVGITVDSLNDLEDKINAVSEKQYAEMCYRIKDISKKLRCGHYFYTALDKCLDMIKKE